MGFYAMTVMNCSGDVVAFPEHFLLLDTGRNTFNIQVNDLDAFVQKLRDQDVFLVTQVQLDAPEELAPPELPEGGVE